MPTGTSTRFAVEMNAVGGQLRGDLGGPVAVGGRACRTGVQDAADGDIEAVEGPLTCDLMLSDHAPRDKFATRATKTSDRAFTQARNVLKAVKLADLI